jgi:antitoxin component of MazEF toxin-antitoxin module
MTIKKLTKLGNSQALVIDKQTLAQMGLSEAGEVLMTLHGQQ